MTSGTGGQDPERTRNNTRDPASCELNLGLEGNHTSRVQSEASLYAFLTIFLLQSIWPVTPNWRKRPGLLVYGLFHIVRTVANLVIESRPGKI
jgi:hypothetical protein